jgi:hypothetical protein
VVFLARVVLAVLAAYHLTIGALSLVSIGGTKAFMSRLYGVTSLDGSPQLQYAVRMLGLQALALGALAGFAAWDPRSHRDAIAVLAFLQAGRAVCRLAFRDTIRDAFGVPASRNTINAFVLVAEAAILVAVIA